MLANKNIKNFFPFVLLALVASTILAFMSISVTHAAPKEEFYVWDGDTILAANGNYSNVTRFEQLNQSEGFYASAGQADIGILNGSSPACSALPHGDISLNVRGGSYTLGTGQNAKTDASTLSWDTQSPGGPASGQSGTIKCSYNLYNNFLKGGNIFGEKGKPIGENCDAIPDQSLKADCNSKAVVAPPVGGVGDSDETQTTSCAVEGIGWIVCPVMKFMASIVDAVYGVVSTLLKVQPLNTKVTDENNSLYNAWSIMRTFANVAFVIAFLLIIYSQMTSVGISNYGIKKMLPRLIVAAILVNVSYWICAIAVDISNILGTSAEGLLGAVGDQVGSSPAIGPGGWDKAVGTLLIGGAAAGLLYVGLSILLPLLIMALVSIVTVVVVLTMRQALIVILIVVSPLALVAYLLPNTESLFKKWLGLFRILLLMFPIIAIIFGGSKLAANILASAASENGNNRELLFVALGVTIIPLFITPIVMKTAGGLLNRFGGFVNNPNKGPFDRMRKGAEGYRKNRETLRGSRALNGQKTFGRGFATKQRAKRNAVNSSREAGLKDATTRYIGEEARSNDGFAKQMAGGSTFREANPQAKAAVIASAYSQERKAFQEDVSNMEALVKVNFKDDPGKALEEAINSGDKIQAVAAQNLLFAKGGSGVSQFRDIIEAQQASGKLSDSGEMVDELRENITSKHGLAAKAKGADVLSWAGQQPNSSGELKKLSESQTGGLSDVELAGQHSSSIAKMVANGQVSSDQADRVLNDPRVNASLDDKKRASLNSIAQPQPAPASSPAAQPAASSPGQTPTSQKYTSGYSQDDLRTLGPQSINMIVSNAGGTQNLSDGDIAKIANATRGVAGAESIHESVRQERENRRTV